MKTKVILAGLIAGAALMACPAAVMAQAAPAAAPIRVPTIETLAQFAGMTGFRRSEAFNGQQNRAQRTAKLKFLALAVGRVRQ